MEQGSIPGHNPAYHPSTYPLQIPHISLLYTVCDRKRWVSVEFTKSFPDIFNTTKGNMYAICPTKYQSLGEDSDDKSPSFLQHLPQVCQVGHTIDSFSSSAHMNFLWLNLSLFCTYQWHQCCSDFHSGKTKPVKSYGRCFKHSQSTSKM